MCITDLPPRFRLDYVYGYSRTTVATYDPVLRTFTLAAAATGRFSITTQVDGANTWKGFKIADIMSLVVNITTGDSYAKTFIETPTSRHYPRIEFVRVSTREAVIATLTQTGEVFCNSVTEGSLPAGDDCFHIGDYCAFAASGLYADTITEVVSDLMLPPGTFRVKTEAGNFLTTESGNRLTGRN